MFTSGSPVTLRLMTEQDIPMLHDWFNRSHIVEWWGGDEARPTLKDRNEQYLPRVLAEEAVTPYIAMLSQVPIGVCPVLCGSRKRGWMVGGRDRPRSERN